MPDPSFQQVDLFATIASVVDPDDPPSTDGVAWGRGRDFALSEVFENSRFSARYRLGYCGIETDGFKYIRRSDGVEELYDLTRDPGETRNVLESRPEIVERCRKLVDERDERLVKGGRPADGVTADRIEQLKALGYVE